MPETAATDEARVPEQAEEEEETCGFCIFMKAGGCKGEFTSWEKCVDQARQSEEDFTEGCREQTQALQQCMLDNSEYYAPLLEGTASALDAAEESGDQELPAAASAVDSDMAQADNEKADAPANGKSDSSQSKPAEQPSERSAKDAEVSEEGSQPASKEAAGSSEKQNSASDAAKGDESQANSQDASAANGAESSSKDSAQQQETGGGQGSDESSQPAQTGTKNSSGADDEDDGGEDESSGVKTAFPLPHAGEEDKTGMPGEPEPEPEEEEEEEEPAPPEVKVQSAPFDVRFPGTNQARHCYARYNEYHKCAAQNGEDDERCSLFQKAYRSICPGEWVERWNEQRESGTWPGRW